MKRHNREIKSTSRRWAAPVIFGLLLLSACQSEPTGQVAAIVDGEEVTLAEINAELANMRVPEGADQKVMQQVALQRVIERKLLANNAKQEGIAETPEFVIRRQQLEDALLVQLLTQKVARTVKVPAEGEVSKFISGNPNMFDSRAVWTVDQIRFTKPARDDYVKPLEAAKTMPEVVSMLDQLGIKYDRQTNQIDTAQLPGDMVSKIRAVPAGEPFVVPAEGIITVSLITAERAVPLTGENARPAAVAATRNKKLSELLQSRLKQERAQSEIKYQPGFAPPADKGAAGAAAGTKSAK